MALVYSPNAQQRAAIEWRGGHALVLAGAGTGKTFTIIERARSLIGDGVDPARIALLTFTRRAAQEMRSRIGTRHHGLFAGTFHAWAIHLMHARRDLPVKPHEWTIIDRGDQLQVLRRIKVQLIPKGQLRLFPSPAEVLDYVSYARSTLVSVEAYLEKFTELGGEQTKFVGAAVLRYDEYRKSRRYLDFDDILEVLADSLTQDPNLAEKVATRYDEVLIDEGQDLNPLQWKIIDALVPHTRVFMVGDDGQSIYGFRGADFESIHSFTKRVPGGTVLRLEENYRSGQRILDMANWLLEQSPLDYDKHLVGTRGEGEKPVMRHFASAFEEADWVANTILQAHNAGDAFGTNKILMRTMSAAREIEASLVEKGIPHVVIGGTSLFALSHTKDLLALVRATTNVRDELAWMRYLTLFRGVGDVTADRVVSRLMECSTIAEARLVIEQELDRRALEVLAPIRAVAQHPTEPGRALAAALATMEPTFEQQYKEEWPKRRPDMKLMVSLAERRSDLNDFIETYTLDPIHGTQASTSGGDVVTLITVHSAKGLEGKRVFIPQAQFGMYPFVRSLGSEAEVEEERRILYVAITRAQDELLLSNSRGGYVGFQTSGAAPAFLEEVPDALMDHVGEATLSTRRPAPLVDLDEWG
jgi:DNA helicase-2/ATP-dependent DNA helicase PcrA